MFPVLLQYRIHAEIFNSDSDSDDSDEDDSDEDLEI